MIHKKRNFIFTVSVLLIIQILIFINNSQKSSFRYFIWKLQEVSVGKLISISFISGLLVSTVLNNSIKSTFIINNKNNNKQKEENHEDFKSEDDYKSEVEIPPQRDIRDPQPTISVNYRVIKNTGDNNLNSETNYRNNEEHSDDWINNDPDW